jgi:hypothetical protein
VSVNNTSIEPPWAEEEILALLNMMSFLDPARRSK